MRCHAASAFVLCCSLTAQVTGSSAAGTPANSMQARIESFGADLNDLARRYDAPMSAEAHDRLRARLTQEATELLGIDFESLARDDRIDWLLLDNHVRRELRHLAADEKRDAELVELLPFAPTITHFAEAWRRLEDVVPRTAAEQLDAIATMATEVRTKCSQDHLAKLPPALPERARRRLSALRRSLREWFEFRDGYDPSFSWWTRSPCHAADAALGALFDALGAGNDKAGVDRTLIGDPIGEAELRAELDFEWIPYTPAELVEIAEREFAWCDAEMAKAAAEMGARDWRDALERVKQRHREPGEQPAMIRDLAHEAIDFVEQRDLITIPPLAKECWRMSMMTPAAQRVNPFFLGGETIQVSFPTESMTEAEKLQSLRSNNEHFCRATVFHELIPGHWLQQYSQARHRSYRAPFDTPFWIEGWALYWEMRLYDLGLAKGPEDRVGMLYWRKHRCARIVFSLNFHLGRWTGPQCVDYLIERVGHERAAAEGEVRRSVGGSYGPLYQAAYMLGGLQLRALQRQVVTATGVTERAFHDAVLTQNSIPIAVLRAAMAAPMPTRELPPWRFADR